ncbi:hypothetical protein MLD38_026501 [Melastoma candidum]|uniref:Uncharacterized protein n=1 Tax=Melastoma candidum TaxID=119954 RepID=A0ACB9P056_9MYRT|nr:hypothetical protein MLD38_026501 [Melastoma candidum]
MGETNEHNECLVSLLPNPSITSPLPPSPPSPSPFFLRIPTLSPRPPTDFTPRQLLDALRLQPDETSALRLFQWASSQPSFLPSPSLYRHLLRTLSRVGSFDSMRLVLRDLASRDASPRPFPLPPLPRGLRRVQHARRCPRGRRHDGAGIRC